MKNKGFTLIEIMVVLSIVGVLVSVLTPRVAGIIEKGKIAKTISLAKNLELAELAHYSDTGRWATEYDIGDWGDPPNQLSENAHGLSGWKGPYISKPLTWIDNPVNNDLELGALNNSPATWCSGTGCSFDLNRNGDSETTQGTYLHLFGIPQTMAQSIDNIIDGAGGNAVWDNGGKVDWDGSLAIYLAGEQCVNC